MPRSAKFWIPAILAVILVQAAVNDIRVQDRLGLLFGKATGRLAYLSWSDVAYMLSPGPLRPVDRAVVYDSNLQIKIAVKRKAQSAAGCPDLWDTPLGEFWSYRDSGYDLAGIMLSVRKGEYHHERVDVRKGDIVIDVGAHLGIFTREALLKGAQMVVGVEPDPRNIECLKRTFAAEIADGRFKLVEAAAWDKTETLSFWINDGSWGSSAVFHRGKETKVPAVLLDDVVEQLKLPRVDFLKMDIEGAERHALAGGARTLAKFSPRIAVCVYHRKDDPVFVTRSIIQAQPNYSVAATATQAYFYVSNTEAVLRDRTASAEQ